MALSCKEAQTVYLGLGENRPQLAAHSTSIAPLCTRDAAPTAAERTPANAPYSRLRMGILSHSARTLKAHRLVCIRSAVILPPRPLPLPHYYITLPPSLLMLALLPVSSRRVRGTRLGTRGWASDPCAAFWGVSAMWDARESRGREDRDSAVGALPIRAPISPPYPRPTSPNFCRYRAPAHALAPVKSPCHERQQACTRRYPLAVRRWRLPLFSARAFAAGYCLRSPPARLRISACGREPWHVSALPTSTSTIRFSGLVFLASVALTSFPALLCIRTQSTNQRGILVSLWATIKRAQRLYSLFSRLNSSPVAAYPFDLPPPELFHLPERLSRSIADLRTTRSGSSEFPSGDLTPTPALTPSS
ncbi:hypothetical protein DFH09DRAFT_1422750 [Mycena vulgaris]|nr:hypothetical protein DFH09DRAFT_1422750 [Mycena vulgaris]